MIFLIEEVVAVSLDVRVNNSDKLATPCSEVGSHLQWVGELVCIPGEISNKDYTFNTNDVNEF